MGEKLHKLLVIGCQCWAEQSFYYQVVQLTKLKVADPLDEFLLQGAVGHVQHLAAFVLDAKAGSIETSHNHLVCVPISFSEASFEASI